MAPQLTIPSELLYWHFIGLKISRDDDFIGSVPQREKKGKFHIWMSR